MLTEEKIREVIREEIKKALNPLRFLGDDELFGYSGISPEYTKQKNMIYLDDSNSYSSYKHPLYVFFQNGTNTNDELIPIKIIPNVELATNDFNLKISKKDLETIINFIRENKQNIIDLANEKIDIIEFFEILKNSKKCYKVAETNIKSGELLLEMSKILPKQTGLDVPIWVQEGPMDMKHGLRIKFKASPDQQKSSDYSSINVETLEFFNLPTHNCIDNKKLRKIKYFVKINRNLIIKLSKREVYLEEFLNTLVKI